MPVVAVAGGTGKLGRAIVDALVSDGKNEVLVLSREASESKEKDIGARIVSIDYNDINGAAETLEKNNVQVVISTIGTMMNADSYIALVKAAERSSVTKRYIPSIWGIPTSEENAAIFSGAAVKRNVVIALEKTGLEYTSVINGYFTDYWALPKVKSYQHPMSIVVDIANNFAAIPGSGDVPVVFTHTWDIASFIPHLLTQSSWEKESYIIGDKITWNNFVELSEKAKGKRFMVVYDSVDKLEQHEITELPSHTQMYPLFPKQMLQSVFATFGLMFEKGVFDFKPARTLNEEFPSVRVRTVEELLNEAWKD